MLVILLFLNCSEDEEAEPLGTCRLYNNYSNETREIIENITLKECRDKAYQIPSNNEYWSAFDWEPNE